MIKKTKKISSVATKIISPKEYSATLLELKQQVAKAQTQAMLSVNKELTLLYWFIGKTIAEKQESDGWGSKVIENLAMDLQNLFPGISGFSRANIFRMRAFYRAYEIVSVPPRQLEDLPIFNIPWWHNATLLMKLKNNEERLWYAQKTLENGWSSTVLELQIESKLHKRAGKTITNFTKTLPSPDSDLAQQSFKDPYAFDFLTLKDDFLERDIEQALIDNVQNLLLELGTGFAFVGRQYHLETAGEDFYIDLLFYHLQLRCFVVVELKARKFEPKDVGQLNFYLTAIDKQMRKPGDNPTIGLLLCKTKNNLIAEYALQDVKKPIGIAGYTAKIVESLPKNLKGSLPTVEEIEAKLEQKEMLGRKASMSKIKKSKK